MPIYEYACLNCGVNFEKRQGFNDAPLSTYENCPNNQDGCEIQRLISNPAIVFKGTGFYINDSRDHKNGANGKGAKKEKVESKAETNSEAKTETKSESKTETKSSD
ncbi:MAG: FmdB family transcriptional regulator [Anaerolineaceae bacterium]|nr:FmdB family transcriptional regulator [Anaerolineaceae bacterium]MCB9100883.1 FmdB family transcriptional regulator [Anaerolineales bacterium]